jgi:transposase
LTGRTEQSYIQEIIQLKAENAALKERIKVLEKRLEELERRLGMNSKNSSKPPSTDPPGTTASAQKRKRKKRGAQKGHKPHMKSLFPESMVQRFIPLKAEICTCGSTNLEDTTEPPRRHQYVDIPPIKPVVWEYLQYISCCKDCGALIYAPLPDTIQRQHFGPGVLAIVGILTGMINTSKRKAVAVINEVFNIPISLGGLSNCEARLAEALEQPYEEVADYVRSQDVAHADETGWPRGNNDKGWLWSLGCAVAAFFVVHARRTQRAARDLLGNFRGTLVSDRYNAYDFYTHFRQICWEHLKRDFKAISETRGKLGKVGHQLYTLAKDILKLRRRVRDGTLQWKTFQRRMPALQQRVETLLEKGAQFDGPLGGKFRKILKHKDHLWTFVQDPNVDPTNNFAERAVRQGVLWRKGSFGTQSERGARYVERMLTVCATCRLQERSIIDYLRHACHNHLKGLKVPSLLSKIVNFQKIA